MRLRANSSLNRALPADAVTFLEHAAGCIERILPHVELDPWKEGAWSPPESVWASARRTEIRAAISIGDGTSKPSRSLTTTIRRRHVPVVRQAAAQTLELREFDICKRAVLSASRLMQGPFSSWDPPFPQAIAQAFDESVVAIHLTAHHSLGSPLGPVLSALHTLSEQSYENKSLTFGCIIDPDDTTSTGTLPFPHQYLASKKYKALSDGYRTAYRLSSQGTVSDFVDLERLDTRGLTAKHIYPEWAERLASASRSGRCGIALSRQGDILIFEEGTLRFTYRYGRWQYWNHTHLLNLLRDRAKAQRVPPKVLGRVVSAIYRAAIDVSFRRSGGLFLILHNQKALRKVVRNGDAINDKGRKEIDVDFDEVLARHSIQTLPRSVVVELASLDGAIVLANSGELRAYGAVLNPKKAGKLRGEGGSRTKAASGASNFGLAIKVSSDGDITIYYKGEEFIRI